MQDMGREDQHHHQHHRSDTELISGERAPYSGPLSGPLNKRGTRKSARFNIPESSSAQDEQYVEVTLDVRDDSVAVRSVKAAEMEEDPEATLLGKGLEKRSTSKVMRNASTRIRQVSQEIKRLTSFSKRPPPPGRLDRTRTAAAHALKGLKFISKTDGGAGWAAVEKRFDEITASTDGLLPRSRFCECIGTFSCQITRFISLVRTN